MAEDLGLTQYDQPFDLTASNSGAVSPASPVTPVQPQAKPSPLEGYSGLQKAGLALEAFGAGMQGRSPLYVKLQEQEMQKRRQNLLDMENRLQIVNAVTQQVQSLPEEKRKNYLDAVRSQYGNTDPQLNEMLKFTLDAPDLLAGMDDALKKDPMLRSLQAQGKLMDFVKSEAGQKYVKERTFPTFAREWSGRLEEWQRWTRENRPEDYQRIMKDGRLTSTEMNDILDSLPENLKPTPQSRSYFMSPDGQNKLGGVLGIPFVTDEISRKKLEKEMAGGESTTLSKHLAELEESEKELANATGDGKATIQRRVDALKKKILAETKASGGGDALKEMRNQIIMKTAKMKEQDPAYKPPLHEQYIIDEYNKADAFEKLRRDILEGGGAKELPKITSDEEYENLPSGAEFIDPQGVRRRKP